MPARNPYIDFLLEQFEPLGEITSRAMFGGHCLYCDGAVFALVASNSLYLKADDANRARFVERGLGPFKPYEHRDDVMSYYQAPPEIFEDEQAMKDWVGSSVTAGRKQQAARRPRSQPSPRTKRGGR